MNQTSNLSRSHFGPDGFAIAAKVAGAVQLNTLKGDAVPWLWPGRIPLGRLTLLVGDPGLGKSLVTLDLAARVSLGAVWPDEEAAGFKVPPDCFKVERDLRKSTASVLLLTAEDDLADTVLPRLAAAGANCSRIMAIPSIINPYGTGDAPADFILHRELVRMNQLLDHMPECRLVVVDPVSAYLTGSANSSAEVRRLLGPLAQLAQQRKLAVLAVSHLRKQGGAAIYRTLGSLAFVSSARAAWLIARDPSNRDRRLMLPVKNNLAADDSGLAYTIETDGAGQPIVRWETDPIDTPADEALRARVGHPRNERDDAIAWLRQKLSADPLPARQVQEEAEAHGIRLTTLRRAFRELDGEAIRLGNGEISGWLWRLPNRPNDATD
jgi:putative DNA primase/helicase